MTDRLEKVLTEPRMLIVDDDPAVVRMLADRCTRIGFRVETAATGIQALLMARRTSPDILLIDVNLAEIDGLSVCQRLLEPGKKPVEVIVMTGSKSQETVTRCDSLGTYFIPKGSAFWTNASSLLARIYPEIADNIRNLDVPAMGAEMRLSPRVLVVDDDPSVHMFLASRLAKVGVDTLYASDSVQGFRIASRDQPSVIISDYYMPSGDVLYMLWRLRSTPETAAMPVFVMSGGKLDEATQQALRREVCGRPGVARFFEKTFDTDELFEALQKVCGFETQPAV